MDEKDLGFVVEERNSEHVKDEQKKINELKEEDKGDIPSKMKSDDNDYAINSPDIDTENEKVVGVNEVKDDAATISNLEQVEVKNEHGSIIDPVPSALPCFQEPSLANSACNYEQERLGENKGGTFQSSTRDEEKSAEKEVFNDEVYLHGNIRELDNRDMRTLGSGSSDSNSVGNLSVEDSGGVEENGVDKEVENQDNIDEENHEEETQSESVIPGQRKEAVHVDVINEGASDEDTADDTDSSDFAKIIVHHVLGHAVHSFGEESDSSASEISPLVDGKAVVSSLNAVVKTETSNTESLDYEQNDNTHEDGPLEAEITEKNCPSKIDKILVLNKENTSEDVENADLDSPRSELGINDSKDEQMSNKVVEVTLDSDMQNESFDFSATEPSTADNTQDLKKGDCSPSVSDIDVKRQVDKEPVKRFFPSPVVDVDVNKPVSVESELSKPKESGDKVDTERNNLAFKQCADIDTVRKNKESEQSPHWSVKPKKPEEVNVGSSQSSFTHSTGSRVEYNIDPRILQSSRGYIPGLSGSKKPKTTYTSTVNQGGYPLETQSSLSDNDNYGYSLERDRNRIGEEIFSASHRTPLIVPGMENYEPNFQDPSAYVRYQRNLIHNQRRTSPTSIRDNANKTEGENVETPVADDVAYIYERRFLDAGGTWPSPLRSSTMQSSSGQNDSIDLGKLQNAVQASPYELTDSEKTFLSYIYNTYGSVQDPNSEGRSYLHSDCRGHDSSGSTQSSLHIPVFKTLQEQQASWMQMFATLDEKHQQELKNQYRQHRETIFNMQQKLEQELFQQQQDLKRKLQQHKSALDASSGTSQGFVASFVEFDDKENVMARDLNRKQSQPQPHRETGRRETSPSWQDIYKEERQKLESSQKTNNHENTIRRSLDFDISMSLNQSNLLMNESTLNDTTMTTPTRSPKPLPYPTTPQRPRSRSRTNSRSPTRFETTSPSAQPIKRESDVVARSKEDTEVNRELPPRSGVFSSPMPILKVKSGKDNQKGRQSSANDLIDTRERTSLGADDSMNTSVLQRHLESRHRELVEQRKDLDRELYKQHELANDANLQSSMRLSLREKHAKHVADLREYYEQELREMRAALGFSLNGSSRAETSTLGSQDVSKFEEEKKNLQEKIRKLEDEVAENKRIMAEQNSNRKIMELRVDEYADFYKEAQEKLSCFRSSMEELQYNLGEKEGEIERIQGDLKATSEQLKRSQKIQEDQALALQYERNKIEKLLRKFDEKDRECSVLRESVSNMENMMYDIRSENVSLQRKVANLELENKRLSRENDNLHHRTVNAESMNSSFGEAYHSLPVKIRSPSPLSSPKTKTTLSASSVTTEEEKSYSPYDRPQGRNLQNNSQYFSKYSDNASILGNVPKPSTLQNTLGHSANSPMMRAEEELYKLRDMMRNVSSPTQPSQPKIQKKKTLSAETSKKLQNSSPDANRTKKRINTATSDKSNSQNGSLNTCIKGTKMLDSFKKQNSVKQSKSSSNNELKLRTANSSETLSESGSSESIGVSRTDGIGWVPVYSVTDGRKKRENVGERKRVLKKHRARSISKHRKKVRQHENDGHSENGKTSKGIQSGGSRSTSQNESRKVKDAGSPPHKLSAEGQDTVKSMHDMEVRYDELNIQKRKLESALSRLPSHGKTWKEKESLEANLDTVEKELASVRMSLKRHHVLKSTI